MPAEWDGDPWRESCRVPEEVTHEPKWKLALQMIDELRGWGFDPPVVLGDAAYRDVTELRAGLAKREISYVLDIKGSTSALPESAKPHRPKGSGPGASPASRYRRPFDSLAGLARAAGEVTCVEVGWREGTRGPLSSRFLAMRVRPANVKLRRADPDGELPVCWLLAEWPPGKEEPTDFWLSSLPADMPIERLVSLAKLRWRVAPDRPVYLCCGGSRSSSAFLIHPQVERRLLNELLVCIKNT